MQKAPRILVATSKTFTFLGGAAALGVALLMSCAGDEAKRLPPQGEGGEAGAAGEGGAAASSAGASTNAGTGGVGGGDLGPGDAGEGTTAGTAGMGGASSSTGSPGGAESGGDGPANDAGAGHTGAAGADSGPPIPVSVCGPGKWFAGEGLCGECPQAQQVVELDCADYASAQVLTSTAGQLQYALANLPMGVQAHEASPVELSVTYLTPDESHLRLLRVSTTGWNVDLRQAPDPPQTIIVPPFSTADVCGDVFHSREPVRFDRVAGQATSYVKVCP